MKSYVKAGFRNENGSAILLVVFLLAIMTVLGITASTTTDVELNIAANERLYRTAFYTSESASFAVAKKVGVIVDTGYAVAGAADPKDGLMNYGGANDNDLCDEILGGLPWDPQPDMLLTLGGVVYPAVPEGQEQPADLPPLDAEIDVRRLTTGFSAGESAEFGTGDQGKGGQTVAAIKFALTSVGKSNVLTKSRIRSVYTKYKGKSKGL